MHNDTLRKIGIEFHDCSPVLRAQRTRLSQLMPGSAAKADCRSAWPARMVEMARFASAYSRQRANRTTR
jgi:hypothetical protein